MGILSGLLTLPLLPTRGVNWVAAQLLLLAEGELHDTGRIRARLRELAEALEEGRLTEEEFDQAEDRLLDQLEHAQRRSTHH